MNSKLSDLVGSKLDDVRLEALEPSWTELQKIIGDRALAILAYGSCLSETTRSESSTPDFYVVVEQYRTYHRSWFHAFINWILPPNIYHFKVGERSSKYNVISLTDLIQSTSTRARDIYHLGRFSKRVALLWTRDKASRKAIVDMQISAMTSVAAKVYHVMPAQFTLDAFIKESLRISYVGDVRVEADDKITRLKNAEEAFYNDAYGLIVEEFAQAPFFLKSNVTTALQEKTARPFPDWLSRLRLRFFLAQSRLRAQLRWPKGIFTVENWLDYLIAKVERTQGIRIELTPKEKRYWFIYGWKHFFRLRRQKLIK